MTDKAERPASLARRRPRPAPDEHIDSVDYTPRPTATAQPTVQQVSTPPVQTAPAAEPAAGATKRGRGRSRRESTIQLGVRVAQDVSDLIEELTGHDSTARAVIENAGRAYAQQINRKYPILGGGGAVLRAAFPWSARHDPGSPVKVGRVPGSLDRRRDGVGGSVGCRTTRVPAPLP
ncbi:hypothetical protein GMA12_09770 [Kocuria sediminis]|uniref:Uncharacterized protein n=1 Tax=Kocuria sediminis TaxID=1038857 RepID=A0A6N8GRG1_9MICC|nr:hypothetical protein [Kocuria sediminis]MUN63424.1 hypothetical protein [Kocuria sediminis]